MKNIVKDPLGVCVPMEFAGKQYNIWSLKRLENRLGLQLSRVPYSIRLLMEAFLRSVTARFASVDTADATLRALAGGEEQVVMPYLPARVLLQDYTGVPVIVDLAAMREAVKKLGGDPALVSPVLPTDVVVDHSIQVDVAACTKALQYNTEQEFVQNRERFKLLRWGERAFQGLRVFPPGTGIVHQVNLENLATVVRVQERDGILTAFPDSVCGTDSHTTMINGLGVLGWGVGGIEAEAAMLGHPFMLLRPPVVGVKLVGRLRPGVTTTDLVLSVAERLRQEGVVDQFVEFCGEGVRALSLAERATIANMAPEYGATSAYFPVDEETLRYLRATGRPESLVQLVDRYYKFQGLFCHNEEPLPIFNKLVTFDLTKVVPSVSGPAKPQQRVSVQELKTSFSRTLTTTYAPLIASENRDGAIKVNVAFDDRTVTLTHGSILIASITSCTNTSNPSVMIAAGLLARRAVTRGLTVPPYVKTSLSPGSQVVTDYLKAAGLISPLETLGFHVTGYGCMTCSGSSGPLDPRLATAIKENNLVATSILSGNRNFEGRIHPLVRANYLASPPLVIAYAIAGTVKIDLTREPLGTDTHGVPVYLSDIWPSDEEVSSVMNKSISPRMFRDRYRQDSRATEQWETISAPESDLFSWEKDCTYIKRPPYFDSMTHSASSPKSISGGRVLALLGDSITTDHLSPGGTIDPTSPAGHYLAAYGVKPTAFNTYGARRGNHEVMMRGTLANIRLKNMLLPGVEGGMTIHHPSGRMMTIYEAAMQYATDDIPLIILAGKEYGAGSSRDWAAKGPRLLGVRVVIANSFERIHRSNLICMGVLPLQFRSGESWRSLGLDGTEIYEINGVETLKPGEEVIVEARKTHGEIVRFAVRARIDTESELTYYQHGGLLHLVVRKLLTAKKNRDETLDQGIAVW
nr:aconitate hydratase AcnA [Numidum massiliense]